MFRTGGFDKLLEKATSHLLMEPDWPSIIQICDLIRQNDVTPKNALIGIKKKLLSPNPHSALYALLCLESMVKNCGSLIAEELSTKANCDFLHELAKTTQHDNVKQKLLELIQTWNVAFRKNQKYVNFKELMDHMKAEGFKFPVARESDAMFSAETAPDWMDGQACHRCRTQFSVIQRKHHCRNCGQVFCGNCSSKTTTLPKFGIEKEVRVCDTCYEQVNKPSTKAGGKQETELPPEYLKSPLAQQSQEPPRKSEEEIKEEEDLQLALALSQSEAEAKEKEKLRLTNALLNNSTRKDPEPITLRSPSPQLEETNNPELDRYLNRSYWESFQSNDQKDRPTSPSAPSPGSSIISNEPKFKIKENGVADNDLEDFIKTLRGQVEIFINRMKSNSSRGRSIANDSSVQSLFMNITNLHSKLLKYIQEHDDRRLYYEGLQDKLTQVKDARAALDALREEHRDKLRREAEEAERQRQLQMAQKLDIMRKKKQEYLQYQRQLALQRIQEQEREMQMRQEQQKQQYLMGPQQYPGYINNPVHGNQYPPQATPQPIGAYYGQFGHMMGQQPPKSASQGNINPQAPPAVPSAAAMGPPHQQHFVPQPMPGHIVPGHSQPPGVPPVGIPGHIPPQGMPYGPPQGMMVMPPGQNPGMPSSGQMSAGPPRMAYPAIAQGPPTHVQTSQQQQQQLVNPEQTETAELISFD